MSVAKVMLAELELEGVATRKVLERMPDDKFGWKPHEKSMELGKLASHVSDIASWVAMTVEQDELDLAKGAPNFSAANAAELVAHFDQGMASAKRVLENTSDADLKKHWRMIMGEMVLIDLPKDETLRRWVLNHMVHHRAQLTVYMRLNDVAVPAVYGSSADENELE